MSQTVTAARKQAMTPNALGAILLAGAMVLGGICTAARQLFVHDVDLSSIGLTLALTLCVPVSAIP